jgi:protein argonaute-2
MKKVFEKITSKYFLTESYRPRITFIIVQKRHHTRLRPSDENDGVEKSKNVPSGTLVTEKIVQKHDGTDFFLCSHEGSQVSLENLSKVKIVKFFFFFREQVDQVIIMCF